MGYFSAAQRAVRVADTGKKQAEIVVSFRNSTDGTAGIVRGGFLVNGNGWRKALDIIHVRFIHDAQKLAGIATKTFYVSPLTLGVYSIESQRAFATPRHPGKNHQFVLRNLNVNVFEIVFPSPSNYYLVVHTRKNRPLGQIRSPEPIAFYHITAI